MRRTKIVCTLGPSCRDEETMTAMLRAGMNVARMNFSHGDHAYHKEALTAFLHARDKLGVSAAVLLDTKGPEIRLGDFEEKEVFLQVGERFTLTNEQILGNGERASISFFELPHQVSIGNDILIDDGRVRLSVEEVTETDVICRVMEGGKISNHKGINVPHVPLNMVYLGERDKEDLLFAVENDVDFIAASFVRYAEDVLDVRRFLDEHGGKDIKIIAKIENTSGIKNFDEILAVSDGIMVARGDMGVEVPYERLPGLQKRFIRKCYSVGKMVITATQMLESMIESTTPTRAEITDVANAVFDGTSAVMLSGETAVGKHPARVIRTMARILEEAEKDAFDAYGYRAMVKKNDVGDTTDAICDAACTTAADLHAAAIIAVTASGYTARCASKFRPKEMIIAATYEKKTFHQLSLSWGVHPVSAEYQTDAETLFYHAIACARKADLVKTGDRVVIALGNESGADTLCVQTVGNKNALFRA